MSENEFVYVPRTKTDVASAIKSVVKREASTLPQVINNLPLVEPTEEEEDTFIALCDSAGFTTCSGGEPLAESLRVCVGAVFALLAGIADGLPWRDITQRTGISWLTANGMKRHDKKGFGVLFQAAQEARDSLDREKLRISVVNRAVNGVPEPVTGRIGKDKDGQLLDPDGNPLFRIRYSDRLAEFALSKLDKPTFGEDKTNINLGNQVIYNIQGLSLGCDDGDNAMKLAEPGTPPRALKTGNKPATIEMPDFVELA